MKILDLDMDYFMYKYASNISESCTSRLNNSDYGKHVWSETEVRRFLENNLGLSTKRKIKGKVVAAHNEVLLQWSELIEKKELAIPFEVIHVDSHADLGLGFSSWKYIVEELIQYEVSDRPAKCGYFNCCGDYTREGIGDYLLFAIAYQWISKLTYCANPNGDKNDYVYFTLKDFHENLIWDEPVENTIQLLYNPYHEIPKFNDSDYLKTQYLNSSRREPEVPMLIIPTLDGVKYKGDFDFIFLAQSPNYTPSNADFIIDIFKEYLNEY
jgi:hypothetical protein